jgi:hypothetical protein
MSLYFKEGLAVKENSEGTSGVSGMAKCYSEDPNLRN